MVAIYVRIFRMRLLMQAMEKIMPKTIFRSCALVATLTLAACADVLFGTTTVETYSGPRKPDADLALVYLPWGTAFTSIKSVPTGEVVQLAGQNSARKYLFKLVPGLYEINYETEMVSKYSHSVERSDILNLNAEHSYVVRSGQCDNPVVAVFECTLHPGNWY